MSDITNGQFGFNVARVVNGELLVGTSNGNNGSVFNLLVYSLANPASPTLVSNTTINYRFLSDLLVNSTGTAAYVPTNGFLYSFGTAYFRFGDLVSVDLTDPTQPVLGSALYTNEGQPDGGDMSEFGGTLVNDGLAYVTGLTPGGNNVTSNTGSLLVVNVADPKNMSLVKSLNIPGTFQLLNVAVQGNRALVAGIAGTESATVDFNATGVSNNLTLTLLDISNPDDPKILGSTLVTNEQYPINEAGAKTDVVSLGNGDFAVSDNDANGKPALLVVDPSNPNSIVVAATQVPSGVHGITVSGSELYATTSSGLSIYNIGQLVSDPVDVTVNLPAGASANIVPGSYNIPPTQVNTSPNGDSLVWDRTFASGNTTFTFSWQSTLSNVQAGQSIPVTTGASVAFQALGTPGTTSAPGTSVTGESIVSVSPATQTVQPGGTVTYDVRLTNPTKAPVTYYESVQHFSGLATYNLPYSVTVPANALVDEPLTFTSFADAPSGSFPFTVVVNDSQNEASGSAVATLDIAGTPILPADTTAHGVVLGLNPTQATAGQGNPARYVVQVTNTGSANDTYDLQITGLPSGINADFGQFNRTVPPGASNFRDTNLTLTPFQGTAPGRYNFTVKAVSTSQSAVSSTVNGTLTVTASGVSVSLSPQTAAPGSTLQATVTNTGSVTDTFSLALGGPGAQVSSLASKQVTLAPGASQIVPITTGPVSFAPSGPLNLTALATSQTNPGVQNEATTALMIPSTNGFTSQLSPATQALTRPGAATALVTVENTGNTEDEYQAVIAGTKGPITASLIGLNGQPTQAIPLFRLPGLSTGEIEVQTRLTGVGTGVVIIQVKSLTTGKAINMIATVTASSAASTRTSLSLSPVRAGTNGPVTLTATVATATTGSVTFTIDGKTQPPVALKLVKGQEQATLTLPSLAPGKHTFQAAYNGAGSFAASQSTVVTLVIAQPTDGPRITNVWRMGYHYDPTTLILGFNEALDPIRAANPNNYTIIAPDGHRIKVLSAIYNAASETVTLHPGEQLNLHLTYRLTVNGTAPGGLTDTRGNLLDGAGNNRAGSNYTTRITMANWTLVLPPPLLPVAPAPAPKTTRPLTLDLKTNTHPAGPVTLLKTVSASAKLTSAAATPSSTR